MNCRRWKSPSTLWLKTLIARVFASPGAPSTSRCPSLKQRDEHAIQQSFLADDETFQVRFELPELFL